MPIEAAEVQVAGVVTGVAGSPPGGVAGSVARLAAAGSAGPASAPLRLGRADLVMRRLLFVPPAPAPRRRQVHRLFSTGILLSALRCLLTYVLLPIVAPLLGVATRVGPEVGLPLAVVALGFDVVGMRRFFVANHKSRWTMAGIYLAVMALVVALMVIDIVDLVR